MTDPKELIERRWSYSINYGPDGQEDWANLMTPDGQHVANIRTGHAIAIVNGMNADALASLSASVGVTDAELYVPGEFCCAKCGFTLSQFNLNANSGAISDRDEPGQKCPNDGAPLWRVTWKQRSQEHYERCVEEMARADKAEAALSLPSSGGEVVGWITEEALRDLRTNAPWVAGAIGEFSQRQKGDYVVPLYARATESGK